MSSDPHRRLASQIELAPKIADQVEEKLRGAILSGKLAPGERLSPATIAADLGISTMPVREALRLLEDDGLVEVSARRWTRVVEARVEDAHELYPLVGLLEQFAVTTSGPPASTVLKRLAFANNRFRRAGAHGDIAGCIEADEAFHAALVDSCNNRSLRRMLEDLKLRIRLMEVQFFRVDHTLTSAEQHDEIVEALRHHDLSRAGRLVRNNWRYGLTVLEQAAGRD